MLITMIFFWVTEAIPLSITALIPILISPFLIDFDTKTIFSSYASPVVFLLLGGFIIANGFEKSALHQRIAIKTIFIFGKTKISLLFCFIFYYSVHKYVVIEYCHMFINASNCKIYCRYKFQRKRK